MQFENTKEIVLKNLVKPKYDHLEWIQSNYLSTIYPNHWLLGRQKQFAKNIYFWWENSIIHVHISFSMIKNYVSILIIHNEFLT